MLSWLSKIVDVLVNMGLYFLAAIVNGINALIAAVGAFATALIGLFPSMPSPPSTPAATWVGWLNWLVPVAPLVAGFTVIMGLFVAVQVLRIAARWMRAL